jgi:hypothetical protein
VDRPHAEVSYRRVQAAALAPEVFEPIGRQFGVADCVLNVSVAQVGLQRPGIMAFVGQRKTTGVPQQCG